MTDQPDDGWMPDPNPRLPEDFRTDGAAVLSLATGRPLAAELDAAPVAAEPAARPDAPQPEAPAAPAGDAAAPPRRSERPRGEIWNSCPVKPLGVNGKTSYYLDIHGQMRAVEKHDQQTIMHLFGHMIPRLFLNFPQWDAKAEAPKKGRFDANNAAAAMIAACSEKGLFDPDGAVRGVGAWADDDGRLIYHTGDKLLMQGAEPQEPAAHDGRIYPAYPPIPHPLPAGKDAGAASRILDTFTTWRWGRPDIDPMTVLGMVGIQMLGGALEWRPTFWVTGPKAAGKSSFQKLILHLHGGEKGLIQSNDATKSGITSRIGHSSLPVALDELEPGEEGSRKEQDIIVLARVASSGGQWYRGSADQKGAGGNVYSAFMFSSILIPGKLQSQDLSRLVILSLQPFTEGTPAPTLRSDEWRKRGAELKRALIDRWPTWRQRLDLWREAFAEHGIGGRGADNWATIMAMAQMALSPDLPTADELMGWCAKVAGWVKADVDEVGSDADEMLLHLLTQQYDIFRKGEQFTIAQWIMVAAGLPGAPHNLLDGFESGPSGQENRRKEANAKLGRGGLRVYGTGHEATLFIAQEKIQGLKDLFRHSRWADGVWHQSAQRVPGAKFGRDLQPRRLEGIKTRGVEIPIASIPGLLTFPATRVPPVPSGPPIPSDIEDFA